MPSFQGGSASLNALGNRLEMVGNGLFKEKVQHAIKHTLREVEAEIHEVAERTLPESGGLNKWVAEVPIFERSKQLTNHTFGAWIISHKEGGHSLKDVDRGRIKHPVFGKRKTMVFQNIKAGYFSKTITRNLPLIRRNITNAAIKAIRGE